MAGCCPHNDNAYFCCKYIFPWKFKKTEHPSQSVCVLISKSKAQKNKHQRPGVSFMECMIPPFQPARTLPENSDTDIHSNFLMHIRRRGKRSLPSWNIFCMMCWCLPERRLDPNLIAILHGSAYTKIFLCSFQRDYQIRPHRRYSSEGLLRCPRVTPSVSHEQGLASDTSRGANLNTKHFLRTPYHPLSKIPVHEFLTIPSLCVRTKKLSK